MKEKPIKTLTYEQALQELEETIGVLDENQSSLDEMLRLFERGQQLVLHCQDLLTQAELKIETLSAPAKSDDPVL